MAVGTHAAMWQKFVVSSIRIEARRASRALLRRPAPNFPPGKQRSLQHGSLCSSCLQTMANQKSGFMYIHVLNLQDGGVFRHTTNKNMQGKLECENPLTWSRHALIFASSRNFSAALAKCSRKDIGEEFSAKKKPQPMLVQGYHVELKVPVPAKGRIAGSTMACVVSQQRFFSFRLRHGIWGSLHRVPRPCELWFMVRWTSTADNPTMQLGSLPPELGGPIHLVRLACLCEKSMKKSNSIDDLYGSERKIAERSVGILACASTISRKICTVHFAHWL